MKKGLINRSFFAGFLVAALILGCTGTALAAYNLITFNTSGMRVDGTTIFEPGSTINTDAGAEIPAVMLVTDELGGGTHYVPIREVANALDLKAVLTKEDDGNYIEFEKNDTRIAYNGQIRELKSPIELKTATNLLSKKHASDDSYKKILDIDPDKGSYISVTVENTGSEALLFHLGISRDTDMKSTTATTATVPAGGTVTRTLELLEDGITDMYPYLSIEPVGEETIRATITATQLG